MQNREFSRYFLVLFAAISVAACALKDDGSGDARVIFEIQGKDQNPAKQALDGLIQGGDISLMSAPTTSSAFDCLAVNVMGPGILPALGHGGSSGPWNMGALNNGNICETYPGVTSTTMTLPSGGTSTDLELLVPKGNARYIQLLGVVANGTTLCSSATKPLSESASGSELPFELYEIGKQNGVNIFGDVSFGFSKDTYDTLTVSQQSERMITRGDGPGANCGGTYARFETVGVDAYDFATVGSTKVAQSFIASSSGEVASIRVKVKTTAATNYSLAITANIADNPDGSAITNGLFSGTNLNTGDFIEVTNEFTIGSRPSLVAGTRYWIVIWPTAGGPIKWRGSHNTGGNNYFFGEAKKYNGTDWTSTSPTVKDFKFSVNK